METSQALEDPTSTSSAQKGTSWPGAAFSKGGVRADPHRDVLNRAVDTQEPGTSAFLPSAPPHPQGGERAAWQERVGQTGVLPGAGPHPHWAPWRSPPCFVGPPSGDSNSILGTTDLSGFAVSSP